MIGVYSNMIRLGNRSNILMLCFWNNSRLYSLPILKRKIVFVLWLNRLLNMTCSLAGMSRRHITILRDRADIAIYLRDIRCCTISILPCINTSLV